MAKQDQPLKIERVDYQVSPLKMIDSMTSVPVSASGTDGKEDMMPRTAMLLQNPVIQGLLLGQLQKYKKLHDIRSSNSGSMSPRYVVVADSPFKRSRNHGVSYGKVTKGTATELAIKAHKKNTTLSSAQVNREQEKDVTGIDENVNQRNQTKEITQQPWISNGMPSFSKSCTLRKDDSSKLAMRSLQLKQLDSLRLRNTSNDTTRNNSQIRAKIPSFKEFKSTRRDVALVPPLDLTNLRESDEDTTASDVRSVQSARERLHIPTFEEFKSMKKSGLAVYAPATDRPSKRSLTKMMTFSQWKALKEGTVNPNKEELSEKSLQLVHDTHNFTSKTSSIQSKDYPQRLQERSGSNTEEKVMGGIPLVSNLLKPVSSGTGDSKSLLSNSHKNIDEHNVSENHDNKTNEMQSKHDMDKTSFLKQDAKDSSYMEDIDKIDDIFKTVELLCDSFEESAKKYTEGADRSVDEIKPNLLDTKDVSTNSKESKPVLQQNSVKNETSLCKRLDELVTDPTVHGNSVVTAQKPPYEVCSLELKSYARKLMSDIRLKTLNETKVSRLSNNHKSNEDVSVDEIQPTKLISSDTRTLRGSTEMSSEFYASQHGDEGYCDSDSPAMSMDETLYRGRVEVFRKISRDETRPDEALEGSLIRSSSDVSDMRAEDTRRQQLREKRQKAHLSDPLATNAQTTDVSPETLLESNTCKELEEEISSSLEDDSSTSIEDVDLSMPKSVCSSTKEDILDFLETAKRKLSAHKPPPLELLDQPPSSPVDDSPSPSPMLSRLSSVVSFSSMTSEASEDPSAADITSSAISRQTYLDASQCSDCGKILPCNDEIAASAAPAPGLLCPRCVSRRKERRNIIQEILETEVTLGRDLDILKQEFYQPLSTAGLLNPDQLDAVFVNLDELIQVNTDFRSKLQTEIDKAKDSGDMSLTSVPVGQLFLDAADMFQAYETYCIHQAAAPTLLEALKRERELLRIFLQVARQENSLLRRMDLKSFLMLPVQRVMKYPLFLNRLWKLTPSHYTDKDAIKRAQNKLQAVLDQINKKAGTVPTPQTSLRRKASVRSAKSGPTGNVQITKFAMEHLGWSEKSCRVAYQGRLSYTMAQDHMWSRRPRSLKLTPIYALVLVKGQHVSNFSKLVPGQERALLFPKDGGIQAAALVLVREKGTKYTLVRDAFLLDQTVVSCDPDCPGFLEVQDFAKEAYLLKASSEDETMTWFQHLRRLTIDLSRWRCRRGGMPNIMMSRASTSDT